MLTIEMTTSNDLLGKMGRRMSVALHLHRPSRTDLHDQGNTTGDGFYQNLQQSMTEMQKKKKEQQAADSLFTNLEAVRLTDEERVYLNAASLCDTGIIRMSLEEDNPDFNVNCVDYMGRNALHLAVDAENMDILEMLLDKLSFECIDEALLHAISKGLTKIVKSIIEHPSFQAGEETIKRIDYNNAFFRTAEKSQFSPDITPIILSAHYNYHEIIQMFLARSHTIIKPHTISCQCDDCQVKQDYDSLKRSRSRLNAYRALASPAYMALSSRDPITNTFELRQEMMKLAEVEKEFKIEYLMLVEQCMNFACEMMDLCRGTQEVEAVISENLEDNFRDPLGRLRMAIRYQEKKFVAHANCQQYLTSIWYGSETAFLQSWSLPRKIGLSIIATPLLPLICIMYILIPNSNIARAMRCPAAKFATHGISHFLFLFLLSAATFRLEDSYIPITSTDDFDLFPMMTHEEKSRSLMKEKMRPANTIITPVQLCIVLFVAGLLVSETKQVYVSGMRGYLSNAYNVLNLIILMLYTASYTIRFIVDRWVHDADIFYNGTTLAKEALDAHSFDKFNQHWANITNSPVLEKRYFMEGSRFKWLADDPEIVSDVLFAVANVLSFARTTYLMPAFEILGPLQISFIRMLTDISRFMVLFLLVLFAFMVGLHNLYWYYGQQNFSVAGTSKNGTKFIPATEVFEGLKHTLYSLFWAMFNQISVTTLPIRHPDRPEPRYSDGMIDASSSTAVVEAVGMFLFAVYHVIIIIVLVNMLIAMMSHSFEDIQDACDVEWKFARTKLWLIYIDNGSTLPCPFNIIPTPHNMLNVVNLIKTFLWEDKPHQAQIRSTEFIKKRRDDVCRTKDIDYVEYSYEDIMQRLVRRYLFKMEREKDQDEKKESIVRSDDFFGQDCFEAIDEESEDGNPPQSSSLMVPSNETAGNLGRRSSHRRSTSNRRRSSISGFHAPPVHLIQIPQLDGIQRSQKILDMRLQNLQSQCEELNCASGNSRIKDEIEHMRTLVGENQKALFSVVNAVSQVQEQMSMLNNNMEQWVRAQAGGKQLRTMIIEEKTRHKDRLGRDRDSSRSGSISTQGKSK